jgi:chaperonin cofactor prefoldin
MSYVITGLIIGGALVWLISSYWHKAKFSGQLSEAERRASSADGVVSELRSQGQKADEDFQTLRAKLDDAIVAKVKAETQLTEAIQRLEEEKKLLEDARTKQELSKKLWVRPKVIWKNAKLPLTV